MYAISAHLRDCSTENLLQDTSQESRMWLANIWLVASGQKLRQIMRNATNQEY